MKILRSFEVQSVDLSVASKKAACDIGRKAEALSVAREQGVVARVEHDAAENLAFGKRTFLRFDEVRCANGDIKNIDVLQLVPNRCGCICIDRFAPRNVGVFRVRLDFCKIPQVLETFLGDVHAHSVKDVSRRNENFAPDAFVLGARVPLNVDSIYKRANTFLNAITYID